MLSINMRIFKTIILVLGLGSKGFCLPVTADAEEPNVTTAAAAILPESNSSTDYYDQRQNGTENYRIQVDGLVVVVAPVESLLLAATQTGPKPPFGLGDNSSSGNFSKPSAEETPKPLNAKSAHRQNFQLINLLTPLLRRVHQG